MEYKTAEVIFNEKSWEELGSISPSKSFCLKAMREYATQEIKKDRLILAEKAKTKKIGNSGSWFDAGIDKESILNTEIKLT